MIRLSVIIPTRNRASMLEKALISITEQMLPRDDFEVIVVDNGSTDHTAGVCASLAPLFPHFTRLYDNHPGLHVGRHLGMSHSRAEILVYADDDIIATRSWLASIASTFEDPDVVLVGGKSLPIFEEPPPQWLERMWVPNGVGERTCGSLSILDLGNVTREISPYQVYGCNFAIRKSVLIEAKGFHPDGMPKDLIRFRGDGETYVSQFIQTMNYKTMYSPQASVFHVIPQSRMTREYFKDRSFNQGISDSFADCRQGINRFRRTGLLRLVLRLVRSGMLIARGQSLQRELSRARQKGYLYHRSQLSCDPHLVEWNGRDNYLAESGHLPAL